MKSRNIWQGLATLENNAGEGVVTPASWGIKWTPKNPEHVFGMCSAVICTVGFLAADTIIKYIQEQKQEQEDVE